MWHNFKSVVRKVWSQTSSIHSIWELVRNAHFGVSPRKTELKLWGWDPATCSFNKLPDDSSTSSS